MKMKRVIKNTIQITSITLFNLYLLNKGIEYSASKSKFSCTTSQKNMYGNMVI